MNIDRLLMLHKVAKNDLESQLFRCVITLWREANIDTKTKVDGDLEDFIRRSFLIKAFGCWENHWISKARETGYVPESFDPNKNIFGDLFRFLISFKKTQQARSFRKEYKNLYKQFYLNRQELIRSSVEKYVSKERKIMI